MKTIVWDVDDVLNDLMKMWLESWLNEHPECAVGYADLRQNPPHAVLGITEDCYLESLDTFRLLHYRQMDPLATTKQWFAEHGHRFHHCALTAVPLRAAPISAQWTLVHFGEWIRTFHFVPSKRHREAIAQYDREKAELLKRQQAVDLFIDDSPENVTRAREAGINALLFPRPWNNSSMSVAELLSQVAAL